MALNPHQEKILTQLMRQEELLSEMYQIFEQQFPEYAQFWKRMASEEKRHAKLIEKLYAAAQKNKIIFDEGKLKTYTLNTFLDRLEEILAKAKAKGFTLSSALVCAVDYETSLIEKNLFSRFESPSERITQTLKILQSETLDHVQYIKGLQQQIKAQPG